MYTLDKEERQQLIGLLELVIDQLRLAPAKPPHSATDLHQAAKHEAQDLNLELLTPLAAAELFKKSGATVRRAILEGHIIAPYKLQVTARPVKLIDLPSALKYWKNDYRDDLDSDIDRMRTNGQVVNINGAYFNILSTKHLVTNRASPT